ncbi:MAG: hypothetical protein B7733_19295 [Myxococcales bacterium FL481]|nr:MAG: hypothetical protein B7733_19295 [Myxococcales bacterium FL481]
MTKPAWATAASTPSTCNRPTMLDSRFLLATCVATTTVAFVLGLACKSTTSTVPGDATPPSAAATVDHDEDGDESHGESHEHGEDSDHLDARALLALVPPPRDEAATKAFMKGVSEALGEDCKYCHEESERGRHHSRIAVWMAENFSDFVSRSTGAPVTCNDCHQGHDHLLPRDENDRSELAGVLVADIADDSEAIKARMKGISDALGVDCDYCHDLSDFSKPTRNQRIASYMKAELVDKYTLADGSPLTCQGCHQGKAEIIEG